MNHMLGLYVYVYIYVYIGCWGVMSIVRRPPNGKSDSVRLRCDALRLRCDALRCDAKLCVRVKRRDSAGWCFKWAVAVPGRAVSPPCPPLLFGEKAMKSNENQ